MTAGPVRLPGSDDPVVPGPATPVTLEVDGRPVTGVAGQSIAGVLLATGRSSWRTSPKGRPRGVFCGIGVCYDCLVTVNGLRDVRACQRRAADGDIVTTIEPGDPADPDPRPALGPERLGEGPRAAR